MTTLLELRAVRAGYDGVTVLHGVDLAVAAGQVVALLGPNGAGKTTTLRIAAGVHPVTSGRLLLGGKDMAGANPRDLARAGVCLIPEGRGVFPNLSVRDNLLMMTYTGRSRAEIEEVTYQRFPLLGEHAARAAGTLSGGEQQMLALARGLATDPAVLLRALADEGTTVVLVEHDMSLVMGVCDEVYVLDLGKIISVGSPDVIRRDETVLAAYLGDA